MVRVVRAAYDPRVPIYEYLCEGCGRITEVIQKIDDPPPRECSECGSHHIAKLVSRSAFQLKGGGWYADLYASPKKGDGAGGAAPGEAKPKPEPKGAAKEPAPTAPKKDG
jgi:putative FmdB family regulatory protein